VTTASVVERPTSLYFAKSKTLVKDLFRSIFERRMRDLFSLTWVIPLHANDQGAQVP
jgi:hypothetical protein